MPDVHWLLQRLRAHQGWILLWISWCGDLGLTGSSGVVRVVLYRGGGGDCVDSILHVHWWCENVSKAMVLMLPMKAFEHAEVLSLHYSIGDCGVEPYYIDRRDISPSPEPTFT